MNTTDILDCKEGQKIRLDGIVYTIIKLNADDNPDIAYKKWYAVECDCILDDNVNNICIHVYYGYYWHIKEEEKIEEI